ncbi:uncharacterized protein LOC123312275 isoform X4 [Coccinella septempunctata]|uniref:uncharacterized protein LOC123312275 isoform X4 n=1 Tax=Coccinella septempunctata TaxID=41139 RepID=UPI001D078E7A|nr:uncharacterized protein LOC123312275 isoform X4 [Coccinella septempunctata]
MGLILSVLVVCVGVYKFIQVYGDPDRKLSYEKNTPCRTDNVSKNSETDRPPPRVQLCRDFLSHEDVEIECTSRVLTQDSAGTSTRRFLVTEKDEDRSRTPSPRKFLITREDENDPNLREFLIARGKPKDNPDTQRFVLIDTKDDFRDTSPLPLPKKFVITQESSSINQETLQSLKQGIGIGFNSLRYMGKNIDDIQAFNLSNGDTRTFTHSVYSSTTLQNGNTSHKSNHFAPPKDSQVSSAVLQIYNNAPEEFHRDPSPYPNLNVSIRKGSISLEMLDTTKVNMDEGDEEGEAASNSNQIDIITKTGDFNTTEYMSNRVLVMPPGGLKSDQHAREVWDDARNKGIDVAAKDTRSKSACRSENSTPEEMRRVSSSSKMYDKGFDEPSSLFINVLKKGEDVEFRNSLDGVKKGNEARRSFRKKKNRSQNSLENGESQGNENEGVVKPTTSDNTRLIFSGEYTKAMNKDWHGQHFCCWQCDESLTGQRYVLRDDHPYCVSCYESVFANACEKCSRTIGIDSKDLSYKDKHWHEACFLCTTCGESLVDKQFGSKGERIYCGRCYDNQFASRCDGCNEIFRAGTKKMEYKTRQWHEKCFCCCVCKVPIGTQSFIPREQEIYCAKCYEEKFATRCIKCNKVITSGGVTYKNEPWHRECFTCTNCSKSLAGERFTSREDKPYCAECFGELFAKRCFACNKPITGIGGTKFISFEDRHWHNDCFFCAMCRTSLVGRGFITDQDDIICPECAKQKLL